MGSMSVCRRNRIRRIHMWISLVALVRYRDSRIVSSLF